MDYYKKYLKYKQKYNKIKRGGYECELCKANKCNCIRNICNKCNNAQCACKIIKLYTSDKKYHAELDISNFPNKYGKNNVFYALYKTKKRSKEIPEIIVPVADKESLQIIIKIIQNGYPQDEYLLNDPEEIFNKIKFDEEGFNVPEHEEYTNSEFFKVLFDYYIMDIYRGSLQPKLLELYGEFSPKENSDNFKSLFKKDMIDNTIKSHLIELHIKTIKKHIIELHKLLSKVIADGKKLLYISEKNKLKIPTFLDITLSSITSIMTSVFGVKLQDDEEDEYESNIVKLIIKKTDAIKVIFPDYAVEIKNDQFVGMSWADFYMIVKYFENNYENICSRYTDAKKIYEEFTKTKEGYSKLEDIRKIYNILPFEYFEN